MLQRISSPCQTKTWRQQLAEAVRDPAELLAMLDLPATALPELQSAAQAFALRVPRNYVARMRKGDLADPLLRQVLPGAAELAEAPDFSVDPVGDLAATAAKGVVHKYAGRALIVATGACAVHCRYCFRRHYPYSHNSAAADQWRSALAYLRDNPTVTEVILSGGDPLTLSDAQLASFAASLDSIPHIRRLRIHTRLPVVIPARIDDEMLAWIRHTRLPVVVVVHVNHANEVDAEVRRAFARLKLAGVTLLNQSVLLKGVNDDAGALADLSEALFNAGVLPYYLHLLDPVQGAAHFDVAESRARELFAALQRRLPGYLVPRLVRERAGAPAKGLVV
ncbi:MAG: lysine 2 3-aminomutase YodO family protein [Gammaproteobacteria bacterium]|nr:MAG: lysine 2 3-aminomutase YodO family protein [Gammaproteobacteria bacterium]TND06670.1 MAG: lysine 2,3-aminomutase YodO family protein [Gammaproteobacteria bacterium]